MGKASHHTTTIKSKRKPRSSQHFLINNNNKPTNYQINSINGNPNPNSQINLNPSRRARSTRNFIPILPPDFIHALDFEDSDDDHHRLLHDDDDNDGDGDCDDSDDDRVQKKVKLVSNQVEKGSKATEIHTLNGTSKLVGPTSCTATAAGAGGVTTTTSLPDRKLLLLILDKLKKKDTRGVFAEPVDPEELPDYHEIIENPMDFGTVKKKLDGRCYSTLEQFEADIYLICSNAMEYNPSSSMFFRQARSIQELAKKEFETLRQEGGNCEPPPKPKRGRPPGSRNLKKLLESSVEHSSVPESSPDATPASRDDDATKSGSYNLRKGPSLYRLPRHLEFCLDSSASASKSTSTKYVKKQYESEENRRETYKPCGQSDSGRDPSLLTTFETFDNRLIPVGLGSNRSYARSLALFSVDLGPVVWKIVSKKIRSVLSPGVEFGPGWVGENKAPSVQFSSPLEKTDSISQDSFISKPNYPLSSGFPNSTNVTANTLEARGLSSSSEWPSVKGINGVVGTGSSLQIQRDPVVHSSMMNGFGGFETGLPIQEGVSRPRAVSFNHSQPPTLHSMASSTSCETSRNSNFNRTHSSSMNFHGAMNMENDPNTQGLPYWQQLSMQERWDNLNMAEPMAGFQSSSSSMPIGSPPQLDLVLQL